MKKNVSFLIALTLIFSYCSKNRLSPCANYNFAPPSIFCFDIRHENRPLPDSTINNMKLYYYNKNQKVYLSDFGRLTDPAINSLGIFATREIGFLSADTSIKDYYLEFTNGTIDTIYVDYKAYTPCESDTSLCQCTYPLKKVMFNNNVAFYDDSVTQVIQHYVYRFNK